MPAFVGEQERARRPRLCPYAQRRFQVADIGTTVSLVSVFVSPSRRPAACFSRSFTASSMRNSPEGSTLPSGLVFSQRFAELKEPLDISGAEAAILADFQRWKHRHALFGRV